MPNKHNADRRHHIAKMKMKVTNWSEYNAGLRRRGSLTLWVTDEAIADWQAQPRLTPGGQPLYSDAAIETSLMLRSAFRMPLRQTEGLMESVFQLLHILISPATDFCGKPATDSYRKPTIDSCCKVAINSLRQMIRVD